MTAVYDVVDSIGDLVIDSAQAAEKKLPGLFNPVSVKLLITQILLLLIGWVLLDKSNFWGLVPFVLGFLMFLGYQWPERADPERVWLISTFGKMTTVVVDGGPTLLLNWIPKVKIVDKVEIILEPTDIDIPFSKNVLCLDSADTREEMRITPPKELKPGDIIDPSRYHSYLLGNMSAVYVADDEDDPIGTPGWKSRGQKLRDFVNNSTKKAEVIRKLDDLVTLWVQEWACGNTSEQMEVAQFLIGDYVLKRLTGVMGRASERGNNSVLDDIRGLGIKFKKFAPNLFPPKEVIDVRNRVRVERANRKAELVGTETMNLEIGLRMKLYRQGMKDEQGQWVVEPVPADKLPTIDTVRAMIVQEKLQRQGKLEQNINEGGLNVYNRGKLP